MLLIAVIALSFAQHRATAIDTVVFNYELNLWCNYSLSLIGSHRQAYWISIIFHFFQSYFFVHSFQTNIFVNSRSLRCSGYFLLLVVQRPHIHPVCAYASIVVADLSQKRNPYVEDCYNAVDRWKHFLWTSQPILPLLSSMDNK